MGNILFGLISFMLIYLFYLVTVITRKNKLDKLMKGMEITYLKKRYKISLKKVNKKKLGHLIAFTNSFIFALTVSIVSFIENHILMLLVGFIILIPLIIICYHILGLYLRSDENV